LAESLGSPAVVTKSMMSRAAMYDQHGDSSLALALQDEAISRKTAADDAPLAVRAARGAARQGGQRHRSHARPGQR